MVSSVASATESGVEYECMEGFCGISGLMVISISLMPLKSLSLSDLLLGTNIQTLSEQHGLSGFPLTDIYK